MAIRDAVPTVGQIMAVVEQLAPAHLAESWDQVGLQVGDPSWPVERVLVSLGVSMPVVEEAAAKGCQMVLAHHPLIFRPLVSVRLDEETGAIIARCLELRLAVGVAHTNLDQAAGGLNDWLAAALGLVEVEPLAGPDEGGPAAMGRMGRLATGMPLAQWAEEVGRRLGVPALRYVGDPATPIERVACLGGAGAGAIKAAARAGAHCFVTGDVKFHEALEALALGLTLVDPGHFGSEALVRAGLVEYLKREAGRRGWRLEGLAATREEDPFRFHGTAAAAGGSRSPAATGL